MIRWCSSIWSLCIWPARFCQHLQYAAIQEAQRMLGRCFTSSGATNGPCRMSLVHLKGEDFEDFTPLWAWTSRFGMMLSLCFWSGYVRGCFLLCFVCEALFPKSVVNCFSVICLSSYPTISLVHWLTDSLPATLPSLFQAFQVELQGFEKEWHLEISEGKNGLGPTWSLPSQAAAKESTASSQMQMALQLWKSLRSVFFFRENNGETFMCSQVWNMSFVPFSRKYGVLETIPCDRCWPHIIWWPWQSQIVLCFCHCSILQLLRTFKLP